MTEILSPRAQEVIVHELIGLGAESSFAEVIEELDREAAKFSRRMSAKRADGAPRRYAVRTQLDQIKRVRRLAGQQRAAAIEKAMKMGLDPTRRGFTPIFHDDENHLNSELEAAARNPEIFSDPDANKVNPAARRFMSVCLTIWIESGGAVRFSTPAATAASASVAGPLMRFLVAAHQDAYQTAGARLPTPAALRDMARRLVPRADLYRASRT